MDKDIIVIYHADCSDGFAAALAAWLKFGDRADYVPLGYGKPAPDVTGKKVYIVDFSFDPDVLTQMDAKAQSITLLDHHKSAAQALYGFKGCCSTLMFDMGKCGSHLAWNFFHRNEPLPMLYQHIEDRDIWVWRNRDSAAFLAALDAEPQDFQRWSEILHMDSNARREYLARGRAMLEQAEAMTRSIAQRALPVQLLGEMGLMANAPAALRDKVGNELAVKSGTFGLVWWQEEPGFLRVSVRGAEGYDVLPLAKGMGGGGHPGAAAFRLKVEDAPMLMGGKLS